MPQTEPRPAMAPMGGFLSDSQTLRLFGLLEKPVSDGLAQHLYTTGLDSGSHISLDQDRNLYCVMDGTVQVFAPTQNGPVDDEDMSGYQLINQVGKGGTLSSLISILSLFAENTASQPSGIICRATEDSTLAIIPAEAFRRVTEKFPKATSNIVQVILTRFSRVTMNAAALNYLGLMTEVLYIEKSINETRCHPLPNSFCTPSLRHGSYPGSLTTPRTAASEDTSYGGYLLEDEFNLRDEVVSCIAKSIGLSDASPALPLVKILSFPAGSILVKTGQRNTGLYYVIEGLLDIVLPTAQEARKLLFTVNPGGISGYLTSLCNIPSHVDILAKTDTYVGFLSVKALDKLQVTLAKILIPFLSPIVLQIDASLDWIQVNAGQIIWRAQDISHGFYIVIKGRLRSIREGKVTITEYGEGDTVGELEMITNSPRRSTMHAIRDSELIRVPQTLFNVMSCNPRATGQLLRTVASAARREMDASPTVHHPNFKTVAILPASRYVPVDVFARKLKEALEEMGARTCHLNQAAVTGLLGRDAFSKIGELRAAAWLVDQEKHSIVLYVADSPVNSPWTHTCIRQADFVMFVGMGDDPSVGAFERLLLSMEITARKDLVLLHPERSVTPGSTREWLKNRPWVHQHTHVELPHNYGVPTNARPQCKLIGTDDFSRLARKLCGKSVGVVLGGGGARGLSHVGVIRALQERGIPIDYISGTSIGALVAGLYARYNDLMYCSSRMKQFCRRMGNYWGIIFDLTYPMVAHTTGRDFNRKIYECFYDLHIEDMWLPFFCNSTNLNTSCMDVHDTGYAWRYIRASMTLAGMLPPLCDNGSMLVDGGYLDNLPVRDSLSRASVVFAADPGAIDDNSPRYYGDSLSGWWLLFNRWFRLSNAENVPALSQIQRRLTYTTSVRTLDEAKVTHGVLYMGMPVLDYGLLDFHKYDELEAMGYLAACTFMDQWEKQGRMPILTVGEANAERGKVQGMNARRNSI